MNRKAFTLIELISVIILLGILTTIAVVSYTNYLKKSREKSFTIVENSFKDAVLEAYVDCETGFSNNDFCKNHDEPDAIGEVDKIKLSELVENEYIDAIKNPYNSEQTCDLEKSYIEVTGQVDMNDSDSNSASYKICLKCEGHHDTDLDSMCGW